MFTGLIEEVGALNSVVASERMRRLQIRAPRIGPQLRPGESVAVNGCCLTVVSCGETITFDLLQDTVARTNLATLRPGSLLNLERAIPPDGRLGGHLVAGHVDCTAPIIRFEEKAADFRLEIELETEQARYVVEKGSIAVNGISLTVAEVTEGSFGTWIIPHTRAHTNLQRARAGERVNLEFDVLAKYVERLLPAALKSARAASDRT